MNVTPPGPGPVEMRSCLIVIGMIVIGSETLFGQGCAKAVVQNNRSEQRLADGTGANGLCLLGRRLFPTEQSSV